MKMRTPITAFQMTSLHWQRSVSANRTMNEKLKLNQLAYIMLYFLEFDRPVSGNIGSYDIICCLSQTSSISFDADQTILMKAREKRSLC